MIETLIGIRAQLVALQDQVSKLIDAEAARMAAEQEVPKAPRMMGGRRAVEHDTTTQEA